jgi:glutaminase
MPSPETSLRIQSRLEELFETHRRVPPGSVVNCYRSGLGYYRPDPSAPELDQFGIAVVIVDGGTYHVGDCRAPFALQSLSKVFSYGLALEDHGREQVLARVGVEPSGEAFSSISFDEYNRPFNPMVNAGAIVTTDLVRGADPAEKFARILRSIRGYAGNPALDVDPATFEAEMATADHNRAITYLMRSQAMIAGDVEAAVALYLQQCSIQVNCHDVAMMGATLANGGVNPATGERVLQRARVRDVLSVMYTCGMYDAAGQWAYDVGVPAKSGVSGAIVCVIPGKMGIGVYSPGLDSYGNSLRGVRVCAEISARLGLHVFATEAEDVMLGAPE